MQDWIITVPKTTDWEQYKKELKTVADDDKASLFFKVPPHFKAAQKNDRCFIVHNGEIRGFHLVKGVVKREAFFCSTTGDQWPKGTYIERAGSFYSSEYYYTWKFDDKLKMKGFQGIRSFAEGKKLKTCGYAGCDDKYRNRQPCALCYE